MVRVTRVILGLWVAFHLVVAVAAEDLAATDSGQVEYQNAMEAVKEGNFKRGLYWLKLATRKNTEKGLYWFNLGNVYFELRNFREAQIAYRQVQALNSPLAPVAGLYEVRSLREDSRLPPAYRLFQQLNANLFPENLQSELEEERGLLAEALLAKGLDLWSQGNVQPARLHLRACAELIPSVQAYQALALIEWREGNKKKGRAYYRRAMRLAKSNSEMVALEEEWRQIDRGKVTRFWAETGGVYNSNFFNTDSSLGGEEGRGAKIQLGVEGFLSEGDNWDLAGRVKAGHTDFFNLEDQSTSQLSVGLPLALALKNSHKWRVTPKIEQELYNGKAFLMHGGVSLEWVRPLALGHLAAASVEYLGTQAKDPDYLFLGGATVSGSISYTWVWSRTRLRTQFAGEDYQADAYEDGTGLSLPLAYHRWGLDLTYSLRGEAWEWYLGSAVGEKAFPNFLLPDKKLRKDQTVSIKSGLDWRIGDEIQAFVEFEGIENSSTLDESSSINKNYRQSIIYLGGRWTTEN